ncbi:MAG: sterol carrier family protein [Propionibacteriaceae bacterium]|jgi:hypothetical protein|nr:sterol carrier family protein [Propionibacteriaceae bacterium]
MPAQPHEAPRPSHAAILEALEEGPAQPARPGQEAPAPGQTAALEAPAKTSVHQPKPKQAELRPIKPASAAARRQADLVKAVASAAARLGCPPPSASPAALARLLAESAAADVAVPAAETALAVRLGAAELSRLRPGRGVELRVPPYAAVQLGAGPAAGPGGGPQHRRGIPPAVVETDPQTFIALLSGQLPYAAARAAGRLSASGAHADLSGVFPLPA